MKRLLPALVLASFLCISPAFANQTGIKSSAGVDLPFSGGENLALVVTAEGGANGFPGGRLLFANGIKLSDEALACSTATQGMVRFNSTTLAFEGCNGTSWYTLFSSKLPTTDCTIVNSDLLTEPRREAPKCAAGYYMKSLIKITNDEWDSYGAICCNGNAAVTGLSYNQTVAVCNGYGKKYLKCPPTE